MISMPLDATVVVGTYGGTEWVEMAQGRAVPSAAALGVPVVHVHAATLAAARNAAARRVTTPWTVHLDADDELEGGYLVYMGRTLAAHPGADVIVPMVRYIHPSGSTGVAHWPHVYDHTDHECTADCLPYGNWVVVGAAVRTALARTVAWEEWDRYEDWAYWLDCYQSGATYVRCADAVYRAHVRALSRNMRHAAPETGVRVHAEIARSKGVPLPPAYTMRS